MVGAVIGWACPVPFHARPYLLSHCIAMCRPSECLLLLCALLALLTLIPQVQADGRLKMCPPGGSSFTMAWSMACSMRRRKRFAGFQGENDIHTEKRALVAPSIRQLQNICCQVGCTVNDLLSYCGPAW